MPRVSVIIPALDAEATIRETLESVVAQSYEDWEVVVADDGCTDDTTTIASAVDDRVRIVRTAGRQGIGEARNTAIAAAAGDVMAFLDADDLWLPSYLDEQLDLLDRETAASPVPVGLVACDAIVRTAQGDREQTYLARFPGSRDPLTLEAVLRQNRIYVSTLVPRTAGEEVGWFDPESYGTADHDLWIRILETGRRGVLNPAPLAVYRHVAGSVSSNISRMAESDQRTYRQALARGNLTSAQRRIAEQELRYHEVRAAVAEALQRRETLRLVRLIPAGIALALRNPKRVRGWVRTLAGVRT